MLIFIYSPPLATSRFFFFLYISVCVFFVFAFFFLSLLLVQRPLHGHNLNYIKPLLVEDFTLAIPFFLRIQLSSSTSHCVVLCSHLERQDSLDIVPRERTTQSLLLNEAISIMFSPELTVIILNPLFPSHSPGHIKLCLSHLDYLLLSPSTPLISLPIS